MGLSSDLGWGIKRDRLGREEGAIGHKSRVPEGRYDISIHLFSSLKSRLTGVIPEHLTVEDTVSTVLYHSTPSSTSFPKFHLSQGVLLHKVFFDVK